jgi:hypothetical protein
MKNEEEPMQIREQRGEVINLDGLLCGLEF